MAGNDITRDLTRLRLSDEATTDTREQERTPGLTRVNEALQREIAARQRAEEELRLLLTITQAIQDAPNVQSALTTTLRKVCEATGWKYGEAWIPLRDGTALECSPAWYGHDNRLEEFRTFSERLTFSPGAGLPGRTWMSRQPEWVPDISAEGPYKHRRAEIAMKAGLKGALGVPIVADSRVLAILVFFASEYRDEDKRLVEIVSSIAGQLGALLQHKRAEEALRQSEERLQAIINNSTRVIFLKDVHGRYLLANREYEELFRLTGEQILGKTDHEIFPKEIADALRANDLKVLEARTPLEFEEAVPQDDGIHTYIANKFALYDSTGAAYAVCGIATDITERTQEQQTLRSAHDELERRIAERTRDLNRINRALRHTVEERERTLSELRQERDFSTSLINTAQVIILLLDTEGQIVHFNPYFEQITGYSLEEVKGKEWFTTFLPERDHEPIRALFCGAVEGVRTRGNVNPILTKDGRQREIEWFDEALKDDEGATIGLLCVGQDITDRKRAESWFRGLIQTTQDALISIDRQGRIVVFNPAAERIFGYAADEIVGRKVNELMAEPYASEHDEYIARYEKTGEAKAIGKIRTVKARRKNGEIFPIELSVTEIGSDENVRYAAFIRDISEKARLQEQLVENERLAAIGTTAAKIGHELSNPLNGMYLAVQLLEQRLGKQQNPPGGGITTTVKKIKEEISRLNQLLGEFRSLSRRETYNFESTSLLAVLAELMEAELPFCSALGIHVEHALPADLPGVVVDRDKLKQVLLNLCKNAAEAMPGGGEIQVRAAATEDSVMLEILDTGTGIPSGIDIFEPFTTTKTQGTGLGLAIAKQIIQAHGGTITYDSRPNAGTAFRITLPRQPNPAIP